MGVLGPGGFRCIDKLLTGTGNTLTAAPPSMTDGPADAAAVARRYLRAERFATSAVAISVGLLGGAAVVLLPLLWGLVVALALLVLFRAPMFRTEVDARLRTDDAPEAVREALTGPTPPLLALQWGIADEVREEGDTTVYDVTYFFGLRSVELRVEREVTEVADGTEITLTITANGEPWGTYTATVSETAGATEIVVDAQSDRRFGLRRLPQQLVAERYREETLTAQGYEVLEREGSLTR